MGRIMYATSNNTDEEYGGTFATQASEVAYDNTSSELTANDVQEAIDDVADGQTVEIVSSYGTRVTNIVNNSKRFGNKVIINVTFDSSYTGTNSPSMLQVGSSSNKPLQDIALNCLKCNSGITNAIDGQIPCGMSSTTGAIYVKEVTSGDKLIVSGCYTI